jgi:hypothetical protein
MRRQSRDVKAGVETHRVNFRRHPVVEVNGPGQIAKQILRFEKRRERRFFFHDGSAFKFDSFPDRFVSQIDGGAGFDNAKQDADLLEQLPHYRYPVTQSNVRILGAAEKATRLRAIKPAASCQHARRVIALVNRATRENVIAAKKAHFRRPARQKDFEAAVIAGTKENDGGSRTRMNHKQQYRNPNIEIRNKRNPN